MMVTSAGRPVSTELLVAEALVEEVADASQDINDGSAVPRSVSASWICRSCTSKTTLFFCPECVVHGNFTRAEDPSGQRFFDRRLALIKVNQRRLDMANEFLALSESVYKKEDLQRSVERKKWTVKSMKLNLERVRSESRQLRASVETIQREVDDKNGAFEQLQLNCSDTKKKIISDQESLKSMKQHVKLMEITIIRRRQGAMHHLLRDIFPLVELDEHLVPANTPGQTPKYCRLLEPILPLDGDYSAYHNSASQVRDMSSEVNIRNPFYEVPAGLAMVAQLLEILIQILDFQMPDLLDFGRFLCVARRDQTEGVGISRGGNDQPGTEENWFETAVQQLNWNILTLCSSQGIPVEDLSLKETVGNLLKLTKSRQLGRTGPYDLSNVLVFTEEEPASNVGLAPTTEDDHHLAETLEAEGLDETDWDTLPAHSSSVLPTANPHEQMTRSTFGLGTAVNAVSYLFRSTIDTDMQRNKK